MSSSTQVLTADLPWWVWFMWGVITGMFVLMGTMFSIAFVVVGRKKSNEVIQNAPDQGLDGQ